MKKERIYGSGCPACGHRWGYRRGAQLMECADCDAIFGTLYLGDSYAIVKPAWHPAPEKVTDTLRYFDFTVLGSAGIGRRHGWYDKATGLIVQIG